MLEHILHRLRYARQGIVIHVIKTFVHQSANFTVRTKGKRKYSRTEREFKIRHGFCFFLSRQKEETSGFKPYNFTLAFFKIQILLHQ